VPDLPGRDVPSPLFGLAAAVLAQHLDGVPVQGDRPNPGVGLGFALDDLVPSGGAVADDEQQPVVEVHLGPAQPARLTTAQAAQSDQPPQRE
jgi:hypothetical protein